MEKVLVLFNGLQIVSQVLTFASGFTKTKNAQLKILLTSIPASSHYFYPFPNDLKFTEVNTTSESVDEENVKLMEDNIQFFKDECAIKNINCDVVRNATKHLIVEETKTSSILITGRGIEFPEFEIDDILGLVECPTLLIAYTAPKIETIILAFDGSKNSQYAIDKFRKIFSDYMEQPTHLVIVNHFEQIMLHKEYINSILRHAFKNLSLTQLEGNEKEEMITYLRKFPDNTLLVIGAYGRNALSRLFHASMAKTILQNTRVSMFLTHI